MQIEEVQQRLTEARKTAAPWREELQAIRNDRDLVATKADLLRKQAGASSERHAQILTDIGSTEQELQKTKERLKEVKGTSAAHKVEAEREGVAAKQAQNAMATAGAAVADAKSTVTSLSMAMQETRSQGSLLKSLMQAQEKGEISVRAGPGAMRLEPPTYCPIFLSCSPHCCFAGRC